MVRYFDYSTERASTRYFTSKFLGRCTADGLKTGLYDALKDVQLEELVQLSMDGPNLNWALYDQVV